MDKFEVKGHKPNVVGDLKVSPKELDLKNLILIIPLLLGVLVSILMLPELHRKLPSDFKRTKLILEVLSGDADVAKPDAVILGSSIAMASVDTKLLADSIGDMLIYNLASTGQEFSESVLFYPKFNHPLKVVVQFVSFDELLKAPRLSHQKIRHFRLFGYEPDTVLKSFLLKDDWEYLFCPDWKIRVDSRGILIDAINSSMRQFFRKDLNLAALTTELYYPTPYTVRLPEAKYSAMIEKYNPPKVLNDIELDSNFVARLKKVNEYLNEKNIKFFLVINPVNPSLTNYPRRLSKKIELALKAQLPDLKFFNYYDLLEDENFIDYCHPAPSGAKIITIRLANDLKNELK